MVKIIFKLFILLFLVSCKPDLKNAEVKNMYDKVMYIHDEAMPKMAPMNKLRKQLKKQLNQEGITPEASKEITDIISSIEFADEQMMDWMTGFKMPGETSDQNKMEYLNKELIKVEKVSQDINDAIENAEILLNRIQQ